MEPSNSLWHKVSLKEREKIEKDSKELLKDFASKIGNIKTKSSHFKNENGTRQEGKPWKTDSEFREISFENSNFSQDGYFIAEKGAWKK